MPKIRTFAPIALIIISLISAGTQLANLFVTKKNINLSDEMVIKWETRIQALRQSLPTDISRVGYLNTSMITENNTPFDIEEFLLMQYSIAPYVLEPGTNQTWIIGNFDNDTNFKPWLDKHIGRYEIQSFNFSLYLIHKIDG